MTENDKFIIESAMTKQEVANKRMFVIILVLIFALIASNLGWICYENQWQYVDSYSFSAEQEGENNNVENITVGDNYGKADSQSN